MTSEQGTETHADLIAFIERELELVGQGLYEEMAQMARERAALLRRLPSPPPESARNALQRAAMLQENVTIELLRRRELVLMQLRRVEHALRAARGYRSAAYRVHAPRIDASA